MKPRLLVLGLILLSSYLVGPNCSGAMNGTSGTSGVADPSTYAVQTFPPAPDLEDRLRLAAQFAQPGTIFELPAGTYAFNADITFDVSHLIIRGQGMNQTILDFSGQTNGSQGILARGDHFTVQDFTILDPAGNGIKTEFIDGATYQRVKVEWTGGPSVSNGAYGFYPNQSSNVLVEDCVVIGARDAGVYVGQSENIIVRRNHAEANVIGIEIENSIGADVYDNTAIANTLGIGIFNLPNLQIKDGRRSRVFNNLVTDNNTPNFASGGVVASVPGGSGVLVIANHETEVYDNTITGHQTVNLAVSSYFITVEPLSDLNYDPYAEGVHVFDNTISNGGYAPLGLLGNLVSNFVGVPIPDITIGGFVDAAKIPGFDPAILPHTTQILPANKICIHDNGAASFGSLNGFLPQVPAPNISQHACTLPPLPAIVLAAVPEPPTTTGFTPAEIAAACATPGSGVNWTATIVNCPDLASYRLFTVDPREPSSNGGLHFDLTTPLFSDYADKHRVVYLPPGEQIEYRDLGPLEFPVGTVIAKTFSFKNVMVETRLLIHRADGWHGLPYLWNDEQTLATYTPQGATVAVEGLDAHDNLFVTDYSVPARTDCGSCHFGSPGDVPIGPQAGLLNRQHPVTGGNQLANWAEAGLMTGFPGASNAPSIPSWKNEEVSLEDRARAYLEANCAHCHSPAGRARFTGLWLEYGRPFGTETGLCKQPVAAGAASLGLDYDIEPGEPELSILWARANDVRPGIKMPELEKSLVHDEGVELLGAWISSLSGSCNP